MLPVGQRAIDLIILEEVVSQAWYERNAQHPVWPGEESGVTIGIGYDLGYHSVADFSRDWGGRLSASEIAALTAVVGFRGQAARSAVRAGLFVTVPFDMASKVFSTRTLPDYAQMTEDALENCVQLHPDAFGALVSITFNRGADGWNNDTVDRFAEMNSIGNAMDDKAFAQIPDLIRAMKRHWPVDSQLWNRRLKEAALFELAQKEG